MRVSIRRWRSYSTGSGLDQVLAEAALEVLAVALGADVGVVVDDNQYLGTKGDGKYFKRGLSQYLI